MKMHLDVEGEFFKAINMISSIDLILKSLNCIFIYQAIGSSSPHSISLFIPIVFSTIKLFHKLYNID